MAVKPPYSRIAPVGNQYRLVLQSGALTLANGYGTGNSSYGVYSLQWNCSTMDMWITGVSVSFALTTTFTSVQDFSFGLFVQRGYTVAHTGGTKATFTTTTLSNAYDTKFNGGGANAATYFATAGTIRMATTTNLTAGTSTIDKYPLYVWPGFPTDQQQHFLEYFRPGNTPNTTSLRIRNQEGFQIQPMATMGAAGVGVLYVGVEWIEMPTQFQ